MITGFRKYMHIERINTIETEGLLDGKCYIFPKIDGMNTQIWLSNGILHCGLRNGELTKETINHGRGFLSHALMDERYALFFNKYSNLRLYGEWLVKHSIQYATKNYNKFYVFDVLNEITDVYVPYEDYIEALDEFSIDYIPVQAIIDKPTAEELEEQVNKNTYLEPLVGKGEGIVIKRYNFKNRFGRTVWGKEVYNEHPDKKREEKHNSTRQHHKHYVMEQTKLIDEFCSDMLIIKTYESISDREGGWSSKLIPTLFEEVYYNFITEELYNALITYGNITIDFNILYRQMIQKIKKLLPELF